MKSFAHAQELRRTHWDATRMSPWGAPPGEAQRASPGAPQGRWGIPAGCMCNKLPFALKSRAKTDAPSPLGFKPHHPLERCRGGESNPRSFPPRNGHPAPRVGAGPGSGDTAVQSRASQIGIPGDASSFRANHCLCHSIGVGPSSIPGASAAERDLSGQVRTVRLRAGLREQR